MEKDIRRILHEIPKFINVEQRVRYESIALTTEIMEINLVNLYEMARIRVLPNPDNPNFTPEERSLMMSLAWGIVDQADLLRRLIRAEGKSIDLKSARDFLALANDVRELRNWMDHLPERLPAFLKRKEKLPPAHGALSFTYVDQNDVVPLAPNPISRFRTVVILSCAMQRSLSVHGEPVKYEKFDVPFDHFVLQSFGYNLELIKVVNAAGLFCNKFAEGVMDFCQRTAEHISKTEGRPFDEVMKGSEAPAGTLVMTATMNSA